MKVSLIAAVAENGVIGRQNDLPWKIQSDMRFFRDTTRGHVVITGRKNYEAMGRALPQRTNLVVSRDPEFLAPGAEVCSSLEAALARARESGESEAFVIGGAELYARALPYAHDFYRTRVLAAVPGDVVFPPYDESEWSVSEIARHPQSERDEHACIIERLTRRGEPKSF